MEEEIQLENNEVVQKINSNNPLYNIKNDEFDAALLQFGSLLSMVKNKRINQTMFLLELIENELQRECFKNLCGIDKSEVMFYNIIIRFPVLCKSKIIQTRLKKLHGKQRTKRIV